MVSKKKEKKEKKEKRTVRRQQPNKSSKVKKRASRAVITKQFTQKDFIPDTLGENRFLSPIHYKIHEDHINDKVLYDNILLQGENPKTKTFLTFERPLPLKKIHFDSHKINVGIVTCGGLCPGLNDVIRSITYNCISTYGVKNVYGFKYGYEGLTSKYHKETVILNGTNVDTIHEQGGTILASSRGAQDIGDMVDTLVKFNISILFIIGGDGTQRGNMAISAEIKRRGLDIATMGVPKTIDNDIAFIDRTFGFDTAVEQARVALNAAHVEARGARNGIGLVRLMGRHSGHIAANAALASGNVNMCLIPEEPFDLDQIFRRVEYRFSKSEHLVIVAAEGVGQEYLNRDKKKGYDSSGNPKLHDIGAFLKKAIGEHLTKGGIEHTIKYIDPSYIIRSMPANAIDSSFCLQLGNFAVHAAMAGKTNVLIGHWNQHFTIVPIKLALSERKNVSLNSNIWRSVREITV